MRDPTQLDLFDPRPPFGASPGVEAKRLVPLEALSDQSLIAALPDAMLAEACSLAAEAGRRRLTAAVPALAALSRRFVGYGVDVEVPEQAAALEALGVIGGPEASRAVAQSIVKRIVVGPTLAVAMRVAAQLGVVFPADVSLALLRHANPSVRALACACARPGGDVVGSLIAMLDDSDDEAAIAAACALGRMGRVEAGRHLKRYLAEFDFRYSNRAKLGVTDGERAAKALLGIEGKRLTYRPTDEAAHL